MMCLLKGWYVCLQWFNETIRWDNESFLEVGEMFCTRVSTCDLGDEHYEICVDERWWDVCKDVRLLNIQIWDVAVFRPDTCKVPVLPLTAWTFLASFLGKTDIDLLTFKSMDISKVDVIFHDVFISWYWYRYFIPWHWPCYL